MTLASVLVARLPYVVAILLVGIGLFVLVDDRNLLKKVLGLNVFQTGIFLFFIASAFREGGRSPLVVGEGPYANPLPQVLILTAIVVGVSVTGVALALVVRIYGVYGTLREDVVHERLGESGADEGGERR